MQPATNVEVSDALRRSVAEVGDAAHRWLAELPQQLADVTAAWDLRVDAQLHHEGVSSVVVLVRTTDGAPAVLKLALPHDESRGEAAALRRWDGEGAVRLLRSSPDGFTLLLERCRPGHDLWRLPVDDQIAVAASLLPRLWRPPDGEPAVPDLAATVAEWERRMRTAPGSFDAPADVVARAADWARELRESQPRRLLHGDLNPGNVLATGRGRWSAIDPKPWFGDPAFDLAQLLMNWALTTSTEDAAQATLRQARQLADRLSLDVGRVLRWAVVKALGWGAPPSATMALDAAARLHAAPPSTFMHRPPASPP